MTRTIAILSFLLGLGLGACNDFCKETNCNDNGYCYEGACICDKWYSGEECDLMFNRNYEGMYVTEASPLSRMGADTLNIVAHSSIPNQVYANAGPYLEFVTDSTLVIPVQRIYSDSNWLTIEGKGKYGLDFIQFEYGLESNYDPEKTTTVQFYFKGNKIVE